MFFLARGKADTRRLQAADPMPVPELGKAETRWGQATDPGPSPELGKADTRSGEGPGSIACSTRHLSKFSAEPENLHGARSTHRIRRRVRHESRPPFRRIGVPPSVIVAAACSYCVSAIPLARISPGMSTIPSQPLSPATEPIKKAPMAPLVVTGQ